MTNPQIIFENEMGQIARVLDWPHERIEVYQSLETGRVHFEADKERLKSSKLYSHITSSLVSRLPKSGLKISGAGRIRLAREDEKTPFSPTPKFLDEEQVDMQSLIKKTALAHIAVVFLILMMGWIGKKITEKDEVVVQISEQMRKKSKNYKPPVYTSPKKIKKIRVAKKKVSKRTRVAKNSRFRTSKKKRNRRRPVVQRKKNLAKMGALGSLGGMASGSKKSAGLNTKSRSNGSGSGRSGWGGAGGIDSTAPGSAIMAAKVGSGTRAAGSGGYGTRGSGGGKSGYGNTNFAGSSGGYSLPLDDEATIRGGLDRDQVKAVIDRHMGQVIFCYEKGLQSAPKLRGRVTVDFVIAGTGRVRRAGVNDTSLRSRSVESCIVRKLKGWRFPKPHGAVDVKVSYPFMLKRVGQG